MFVEKVVCRPGISGGLRFAREASGYAEIAGGGCFSVISVSEEEASMSNSVPDEASMATGAVRLDVEFVREGSGTSSFTVRFGGGGKAVRAMVVALLGGFTVSCLGRVRGRDGGGLSKTFLSSVGRGGRIGFEMSISGGDMGRWGRSGAN